jgi:hypothetical protein
MKTSVFDVIFLICLIVVGCNPTTYLSLTENDKEQIKQKLECYERDDEVGVEVKLLKTDGEEIKGELLSVRDSIITLITKHSATDLKITNLKYPIITLRNNEIKEFTIKGSNYVWIGLAIGSATFTGTMIWIGNEMDEGLDTEGSILERGIYGFLIGATVGGIVGYLLSKDDVILFEIPPDYNFSLLKPLARYNDEEQEYLK